MFEEVVNKQVKIVFLDGNNIIVIRGQILDWDSSLKMLLIKNKDGVKTYINVSQIQKLEVEHDL